MTKRRWIIAGILAASASVALAVFVLRMPRPNVTEERCGQIEIGMTMQTVESIFGVPSEANFGSKHYWTGEKAEELLIVTIDFNAQGTVVKKEIIKAPLDFTNKILRLLGFSIL